MAVTSPRLVGILVVLQAVSCSDRETIARARAFETRLASACNLRLVGDPVTPDLRAALIDGRTMFDPAAAEACISWLEVHGCVPDGVGLGALAPRLPGQCVDVYRGTTAIGSSCRPAAKECSKGGYCEARSESAAECTARVSFGSACGASAQCETKADVVSACLPDASGGRSCAAESVVSHRASEGQLCGDQLEGSAYVHVPCAQGLSCPSGVMSVCRRR